MSIYKIPLQENVLDASAERIDWTLNNFSSGLRFLFRWKRFYRDAASRCPESTAIKAKNRCHLSGLGSAILLNHSAC